MDFQNQEPQPQQTSEVFGTLLKTFRDRAAKEQLQEENDEQHSSKSSKGDQLLQVIGTLTQADSPQAVPDLAKQTGIDFMEIVDTLRAMASARLVTLNGQTVEVTSEGRALASLIPSESASI